VADVDDLEEIGDLEGYIKRTSTMLIYCTSGYFTSKNCMRELVATATQQKPCFALTEPEAAHGGLSANEVLDQLVAADDNYDKWSFGVETPRGRELNAYLLATESIEWNRECKREGTLSSSATPVILLGWCAQGLASFKTSPCASSQSGS
jgi:hypothetical protein